ncbi:MAG TPA: betaine/proline/choline family ABC transporter ATP-binding protein [Magnetospirillaceae bacterium]|nr:betaine/proline/choline family ABC transporter ATP-binding protein [Magnetospirillaceae bacterium]
MSKIEIKVLTKLFGAREGEAVPLVEQGADKATILAKTGCTLALRRVTLDIEEGEIFVVIGLSGSGKSTLVRHINRLIDPTAGQLLVDGQDVLGFGAEALREFRRRSVSMVFQGFGLMPHRSVLDNVAFGLLARGEDKKAAHEKARGWIETVGLTGYEQTRPDGLSGGMRQRVGLARALAVDTGILLMDEAFSALDPLTRADMQDLLLDLQARLRKTVLFVTHDIDEAARLGNRIAVMRDGEVVQSGAPREILTHPKDEYVRRFVQVRSTLAKFAGNP